MTFTFPEIGHICTLIRQNEKPQFMGVSIPSSGPDHRQLPHSSVFLTAYYRDDVFSGARNDWWDFSLRSFSSGQNKPLSQRAALCGIHSCPACYKVTSDKEQETRKAEAIRLLQSLDEKYGLPLAKRIPSMQISYLVHSLLDLFT